MTELLDLYKEKSEIIEEEKKEKEQTLTKLEDNNIKLEEPGLFKLEEKNENPTFT